MKTDMLASQFEALDEPSDALVVDISASPSTIVKQILSQVRRPRHTSVAEAPEQETE
jgi:gluconate kinase